MADERFRRPPLERDRPIRTWATLFGPPPAGARPAEASGAESESRFVPSSIFGASGGGAGAHGAGPDPGPLGDAVTRGYRVINEYMRQGQAFAQAFHPASKAPSGPGPDAPAAVPADMQALAQRVMQYGWDFAGLWFELWSRMSGTANGWSPPSPPPPGAGPSTASESAPMPPQGVVAPEGVPPAAPGRLSVSVRSPRSTRTTVELRPGAPGALTIHPLRPESAEAPALEEVAIESDADGAVSITVTVPADQPPGVYNGLIVDRANSLPRGSLSLTVGVDEAR